MIEPNFEDELKAHGMTPEQYKKFMDDWEANEYEQMLKNLTEDNYWDDCARQDGLIYPWE